MATTPKKPVYNSESQINKIYDEKYNAGKGQLEITKNDTLTGITGKETQANNTYNSSLLDINKNIQNTQNKYKDIYTGFDNKKAEAKTDYYNQRDGAMFQNAKNVQSLREYMARNNLSSSGESVDGMLVNNTNFSNTMGGIRNNEQLFLRDIGNQIAQNQRDEQSAYTGYNNDKTKAYNLLNSLLSGYANEKTTAIKNYDTGLSSLLSGNNSDRANAIYNYNEALRQEQTARENAEAQRLWEEAQAKAERDWKTTEAEKDRALSRESIYARSSGGSGSDYYNSDGELTTAGKTAQKESVWADINESYYNNNLSGINEALGYAGDMVDNGEMTLAEYNKMVEVRDNLNNVQNVYKQQAIKSPTSVAGYSNNKKPTPKPTPKPEKHGNQWTY